MWARPATIPSATRWSHVLGYVAAVSPRGHGARRRSAARACRASASASAASRKPFDKRGARHAPALSRVEVNAYGRVIRELGQEPGVPGQDVWLTIDGELQHFADQRLAGESAACVVMDVTTGDVLALASTPGFDPNWFNVGITGAAMARR